MENLANKSPTLALESDDPWDDEERARLSAVTMISSKERHKTAVKKKQDKQGKGKERREASTAGANKTENQPEQQNPRTSLRLPLVWIHLEMTGLEIEKDRILEIACIITDGRLVRTVEVLEFVKQHAGSAQPLLAGNCIYVDFMFLRKYMPNLASLFSHVIVDVSSIKALCFRWYPKDAGKAPAKKNSHRSLDNIKDSIAELKCLQMTIFKTPQQ